MKKLMIVLALILFVSSSVFAVTTVGTDDLVIYGMIAPGATDFQVVQTQLISERVDLLSAAVEPTSNGMIIGNWIFSAINQESKAYRGNFKIVSEAVSSV